MPIFRYNSYLLDMKHMVIGCLDWHKLALNNIYKLYPYYKSQLQVKNCMAEQQIEQLTKKLQASQQQFENYKAECKQLEDYLQSQSNKKQQEIKKLKEEAIKKQKTYGIMKTQVGQLQSENSALKAELAQLKQKQANSSQSANKSQQYLKQIESLKTKIQQIQSECEQQKQKNSSLETKIEQISKNASKGKSSDGEVKKLQQAISNYKSKIADLEKQNQKLKEQIKDNKKAVQKDFKSEEKKVERDNKDNKDQEKYKQKIEKLQKKLSQSQHHGVKAEQTSNKLSKLVKELKGKLSAAQADRQNLSRKVKQLSQANSAKKQQKMRQNDQLQNENQDEQIKQSSPYPLMAASNSFSALVLTKKHYVSPFLEFKNDNSIKLYKSTKNGAFQKSLGSTRYKVNQVSYHTEQLLDECAKNIQQNISNSVKNSIIFFGPKKTTKKYMIASLLMKIKDFLVQKVAQSEEKIQVLFVSASSDPQKRIELHGNTKQQLSQIIQKIIQNAQKSPKKSQLKGGKTAPKPKARSFVLTQGQLYLQIITTSFTNFPLKQNLSFTEALNNIAYSRLPNALQPTDCFRLVILVLNPIVSLYDQCKNTLSIVNSRKNAETESNSNQMQLKNSQIKDQLLNDTARKKLQSIQRESEQNVLKIRRQQEDINFYRTKFDQLQLRLKNLLNTHRQQNTYLKKSPVTLSYEKMLKFVHSVQAKSQSHFSSTNNNGDKYNNFAEQVSKIHENAEVGENEDYEEEHGNGDGGEDFL